LFIILCSFYFVFVEMITNWHSVFSKPGGAESVVKFTCGISTPLPAAHVSVLTVFMKNVRCILCSGVTRGLTDDSRLYATATNIDN